MTCFRLLHISDCHVAAKPGVFGWPDHVLSPHYPRNTFSPLSPSSWDLEIAYCLTSHLIAPCNQLLHGVLLSGDLVTSGRPRDFEEARRFVRQIEWALSAPDAKGRYPRPQPRLLMLPGNHDRFGRWLNFPGNRRF